MTLRASTHPPRLPPPRPLSRTPTRLLLPPGPTSRSTSKFRFKQEQAARLRLLCMVLLAFYRRRLTTGGNGAWRPALTAQLPPRRPFPRRSCASFPRNTDVYFQRFNVRVESPHVGCSYQRSGQQPVYWCSILQRPGEHLHDPRRYGRCCIRSLSKLFHSGPVHRHQPQSTQSTSPVFMSSTPL